MVPKRGTWDILQVHQASPGMLVEMLPWPSPGHASAGFACPAPDLGVAANGFIPESPVRDPCEDATSRTRTSGLRHTYRLDQFRKPEVDLLVGSAQGSGG